MRKTASQRSGTSAFSLLEVVVALGVFSGAILVIIGLSSPLQRRVSDTVDAEVAASLVKNIESELRRIGYADLIASPLYPRLLAASDDPLVLFATPDGNRVLVDTAADNSLTVGDLRGIAQRDRYFRVRVVVEPMAVVPDAGWLSLRADVSWPFRVPVGPATPDADSANQDPSEVTPEGKRSGVSYFFGLVP